MYKNTVKSCVVLTEDKTEKNNLKALLSEKNQIFDLCQYSRRGAICVLLTLIELYYE